MQKFNTAIPLSLYIHLPWCVRKCPYCDFNSHEARDNLPEDLYIQALIKDLDANLPLIWGRKIISIFFGGGTPSLFSAAGIEKILTAVHTRLNFGPDIEITLEANPGTIDESRFIGFRTAGVNRLSLGLQSLQSEKLKALGRIHDREQALGAIQAAKNAGFTNFNLDLMHGLPNQSADDALQDLRDAIAFEPTHLSWYQLTIEPNTYFHHSPPVLPEEDILWDIQDSGKNLLQSFGYNQYEVSAYCKAEKKCVHNMNYWQFGDYLGIGAGAHSKITDLDNQCITRHWQVKHPKDYLDPQKQQTAETKIITGKNIIFEFMLNALRLTEGVTAEIFAQHTGLTTDDLEPILTQAKTKKLLEENSVIIRPTELGQRFLNDLTSMFLTD